MLLIQAQVSLKRLEAFFLKDEIDSNNVTQDGTDGTYSTFSN